MERRARRGETWLLPTEPGIPSRWFLHELALEMGMPVDEMCNRMSAHELCVEWPAFFSARHKERVLAANEEAENRRRRI